MAIMIVMAMRENEFELKLGRIGHERSSSLARVRASVRQRAGVSRGPKSGYAPRAGIKAHFRKGSAGKARPVMASSRRVVVKARFVVHGGGKCAPLRAHVSYLAREQGQARGEPGLERAVDYLQREETPNARLSFYDGGAQDLDGNAITAGWADDSRHFRLIISAEDGEALGDLRPMIREVMSDLERQVGTKLEWVAVDHWDTDNPHTHVLVRGRRSDGQDLFIPSKVISHGIREKAQAVVTRVLGPRLEADIARDRWREIDDVRVTPLDRQLVQAQGASGHIVIHRPDLIARLERLEGWGLATRGVQGWRIAPDLFGKLKAMEQHAQVETAVSGHLSEGRPLPVLAAVLGERLEGMLVHLGPSGDLDDNFVAVIETGRAELRYARFERQADMVQLDGAMPGAQVAFEPNLAEIRPSDRAIVDIADRTGGLYSAEHHLAEAPSVSRGLVQANIRRLEAMRRMSLVSRTSEGDFLVGHDHLKRALMYEERVARRYPLSASVASYWSLEEQINAIGPTRLDRVLAGEAASPEGTSAFARQHAAALQQRRLFLIDQGWLGPNEQALSRDAMRRMAETELRGVADDLSAEIGKPVLSVRMNAVSGVYARRIDLAQGRVALIVGERHANLVPWRPALERFAGREVIGELRAQGMSWQLQRGVGISLPPMG
ncbi:MAG TPA: DUF3363 domain-containing protein [Hyphomonadaceae bacterium]|nr:DUF3363 domain-containing protein [Hyphomonadaceae bacterium]HPI48176.1 DUF3363 domain-containing protein [Hyphomonadaceae bacterium]